MNKRQTFPSATDANRSGLESAMRAELAHVLGDPAFRNSPTLSRLLGYLVRQTLAGEGDRLKSYTVAVDGLGKPSDFDAQSDSYARVQAMRLRKQLEAFYARRAPLNQLCLHLPSGSYRVRLARPEVCYPDLYRPLPEFRHSLSPPVPQPPVDQPTERAAATEPSARTRSPTFLMATAIIVAAAALLAIAGLFVWATRPPAVQTAASALAGSQPPLLLIDEVASGPDAKAAALADEIRAKLIDGIGRSWVVRIVLDPQARQVPDDQIGRYRLRARLGGSRGDRYPLYIGLTDMATAELLWSTSLPYDPELSMSDNIGGTIAHLANPFGVIASRELRRLGKDNRGQYACLLRYMAYLKAPRRYARPPLDACLARAGDNPRLNAARLALRSFFVVETARAVDRERKLHDASLFAYMAINAEPAEAYAHFAMARVQYSIGNCAAGNRHAGHTVALNPYDPIILSILGNFAGECDYPGAARLVERAFAFRSPGDSFARLSLVLSAIRDQDRERLRSLAADANGGIASSPAYYHLCETLIATALGKRALATYHWQKLKAASQRPDASADELLGEIIIARTLRARVITYLVKAGILLPAEAKPSQKRG